MKHIRPFLVATLLQVITMWSLAAQEIVTVKFTASTQNDLYCSFDEVNITNVTRGWSETLEYPDTILILTNTLGIGNHETTEAGLVEVYPNPFAGETCAVLSLNEASLVHVRVFSMNGALLSSSEANLGKGRYQITISLKNPQMALLCVDIAQRQQVVKMLNTESNNTNSININSAFQQNDFSFGKNTLLGDFEPGDVMRYEGVITLGDSIIYSDVVMQPQFYNELITLRFNLPEFAVPEGAINGLFTINANGDQVYFSQGNLQYQASTDTWRFAESQWDYVGEDNSNISSEYDGWIDLFGWGTSGYHNVYDSYNVNYQPYSTSAAIVNTECNYYGYGPSTNMYDLNLTGMSAEYDWGVHNAISNGGNQAGLWRTLTSDEWEYVFFLRSASTVGNTLDARFAKATVNGISGVILFPDVFSVPIYFPTPLQMNNSNASFDVNTYSGEAWLVLEDLGCIFMPVAGYRNENLVSEVGSYGYYWSCTRGGSSASAKCVSLYSNSSTQLGINSAHRFYGSSVRLVRPLE